MCAAQKYLVMSSVVLHRSSYFCVMVMCIVDAIRLFLYMSTIYFSLAHS